MEVPAKKPRRVRTISLSSLQRPQDPPTSFLPPPQRRDGKEMNKEVEGIGTVKEVYAQGGCLEFDNRIFNFDLRSVKYGFVELKTDDLTEIIQPEDRVFFLARAKDHCQFGPDMNVVSLEMVEGQHINREHWTREEFGTIIATYGNGGKVLSDRWGELEFEDRALVLEAGQRQLERGRTVSRLSTRIGKLPASVLWAPCSKERACSSSCASTTGSCRRRPSVVSMCRCLRSEFTSVCGRSGRICGRSCWGVEWSFR